MLVRLQPWAQRAGTRVQARSSADLPVRDGLGEPAAASRAKSAEMSIPVNFRSSWIAASPVVPLPANGSSTVPPGLHPAAMHRSGRSIGYAAKCGPLCGRVGTDHTSPGLRPKSVAVPAVTVLCFHPDPATTRGEAEYIAREAKQRGWTSIILVTTPDQAWRAELRTSRCFPGRVYVATAPLPVLEWFTQIPYQWAASAKALTVQRGC